MKLLHLSLKNATVKWWRSLTLGMFIFTISIVMIIANSFLSTIQDKVETVISQGITGHVQIRSDQSFEEDMVEQYNKGWDAIKPLSSKTNQTLQEVLHQQFSEVDYASLVRWSGYLTNSGKREETMLIGIPSTMDTYKEAFVLNKGNYLDPKTNNQILLTEEQAQTFQVDIGDTITVTSKNRYGLNSRKELEVVGIGNFIMLSLFSYKACYLPDSSVRELVSLEDNEVTDLILFLPDEEKTSTIIHDLASSLENIGIETLITKDEKISSTDLQITKLDFDQELQNAKVKLSSYTEMGQSFKSTGDILFLSLNIVIIFLMSIVSILITNLVYMIGIERYQEIGTLRAIGYSKTQVIRIFMGEILTITLIFGILGILISSGIILFFSRSGIPSPIPAMDFIMGKTLYLKIKLMHIIKTILIFISFSLAASFYPAYKACSVKPAELIRTV